MPYLPGPALLILNDWPHGVASGGGQHDDRSAMPLPSHSDGGQDGRDRRQLDRLARANEAAMDDGALIATGQP